MSNNNSRVLQGLAEIPRGETETLRLSLDEFVDDRGVAHQYISARIWFKGKDGQWLPTKKGLTIRQREIMDVGKALKAGLDGINEAQCQQRKSRAG